MPRLYRNKGGPPLLRHGAPNQLRQPALKRRTAQPPAPPPLARPLAALATALGRLAAALRR